MGLPFDGRADKTFPAIWAPPSMTAAAVANPGRSPAEDYQGDARLHVGLLGARRSLLQRGCRPRSDLHETSPAGAVYCAAACRHWPSLQFDLSWVTSAILRAAGYHAVSEAPAPGLGWEIQLVSGRLALGPLGPTSASQRLKACTRSDDVNDLLGRLPRQVSLLPGTARFRVLPACPARYAAMSRCSRRLPLGQGP